MNVNRADFFENPLTDAVHEHFAGSEGDDSIAEVLDATDAWPSFMFVFDSIQESASEAVFGL